MDWFLYDNGLCHERVKYIFVRLNKCFSIVVVACTTSYLRLQLNMVMVSTSIVSAIFFRIFQQDYRFLEKTKANIGLNLP